MSEYAADKLQDVTLKTGWKVINKIESKTGSGGGYSTCYYVTRGAEKGFLKAFDYRDVAKTDGGFKKISAKFEREKDLLKKCTDKSISTVIKFIEHGKHFLNGEGDLNGVVDYFIIEYSEQGNVEKLIKNKELLDLKIKFEALRDLFDGLDKMHLEGVVHLDIKPSNLVYFISDRLTKITDFGSARIWVNELDEELKNDHDRVIVTRAYAPPEHLYNCYHENWQLQRKKIDLYLAGNVIVKLFTNLSFTALLKKEIYEGDNWNNNTNQGKLEQLMPNLLRASSKVYILIEKKLKDINERCDLPLEQRNIDQIMDCIKELCSPDCTKRGYPKLLKLSVENNGLDRYRDRFILLARKVGCRSNQKFN